jgi:hypothetical protein
MLRRIPFNNKLLSLEQAGDSIYIGDSRGCIYKMDYPFCNSIKVHNVSSPISSLLWHKNRLFFANWDGEVGFTDFKISKSVSLVRNIVKCMTIFRDHIFVSIDHIIYILDLELKTKGRLEPPHKVLSFFPTENKCLVVMSVPFLGEIVQNVVGDFVLINVKSSKHDTAILSIHKDLTGSSDGKIMRGDNIIYSSSGWINSIFSEYLFSCGRSIILKNENGFKEIYAHKDDVMKVLRIKNKIISIGLDYTVCVWEEEMITEEELKEIEELNKMF